MGSWTACACPPVTVRARKAGGPEQTFCSSKHRRRRLDMETIYSQTGGLLSAATPRPGADHRRRGGAEGRGRRRPRLRPSASSRAFSPSAPRTGRSSPTARRPPAPVLTFPRAQQAATNRLQTQLRCIQQAQQRPPEVLESPSATELRWHPKHCTPAVIRGRPGLALHGTRPVRRCFALPDPGPRSLKDRSTPLPPAPPVPQTPARPPRRPVERTRARPIKPARSYFQAEAKSQRNSVPGLPPPFHPHPPDRSCLFPSTSVAVNDRGALRIRSSVARPDPTRPRRCDDRVFDPTAAPAAPAAPGSMSAALRTTLFRPMRPTITR